MADHGGTDDRKNIEEGAAVAKDSGEDVDQSASKPLMQEEDRNTGQIQWHVYGIYIAAAGGFFWTSVIMFLMLAEQGAQSTCFKPDTLSKIALADPVYSRHHVGPWLVDQSDNHWIPEFSIHGSLWRYWWSAGCRVFL